MVITETRLRERLTQGSVCYFVNPQYPAGQPHYLVLLNHTIDDEYPLYFVEATSDVEKIRTLGAGKGFAPETFVEISAAEYTPLTD